MSEFPSEISAILELANPPTIEEELGEQVSNFTKQLIFNFLEEVFSDQLYQQLKENDDAAWQRIVQKRIEGKKQAKMKDQGLE